MAEPRGVTPPGSAGKASPRQRQAPLAPRQEWLWAMMWFFNPADPGNATHVVQHALRLTGQLDVQVAERALNEIVRRHDALRITLGDVGSRPVQVVAGELALPLSVIDLSAAAGGGVPPGRHAVEERARPFDLSKGPLVRTVLLRIGPREHVLVATASHIIFDGWSARVFGQELAALYNAFLAGRPSPLPEPALQYADFAEQQLRSMAEDGASGARIAYWERRLRGAPAVLDLPTKRPRNEAREFESAHFPFELDSELTADLRALARRTRVTLFMVLLAAFTATLHRHSGQSDIVIGTVVSGRDQPRLASLIGMYANIMFLRTDLSGDPTFHELLQRVRRVTLEAFRHHDVSYERLLDRLHPGRDATRLWHPMYLFHAWFSLLDREGRPEVPEMTGLTVELPTFRSPTGVTYRIGEHGMHQVWSRQNPHLVIRSTDNGLAGMFDYNRHLFDIGTVAAMHASFQTLLERVARGGDLPLRDLFTAPRPGR